MELSDYVTLVFTVPETHAERMREVLGRAGAGKVGDYSHCSYSVRGIGRFLPNKGSNPYLGKEGVLEEVVEERVETLCSRSLLSHVLAEIKRAHPYEEMVIDIYPVYEMGRKKASERSEVKQEALPRFSPAAQSIVVGTLYEHYKGYRYKILAIARHSESLEELVVYQALYGEGGTWVRPLSMFLEHITIKGRSQPRFKLVE